LFPYLTLVDFKGIGVRRSEGAEDMVRIGGEEPIDGR